MTELIALLGHPVAHSLSPRMQNAAFAARGLDWTYVACDVEPGAVEAAVRGLDALGFAGANVTAPHKAAVAKLVGSELPSVNTLVGGTGYSTDIAILEGLEELPGAKFGERGVTAQEAVALVAKNPDEFDTLRSVLLGRGTSGKPATSTQLGNILRGLVNTPIGGLKLRKHPILQHRAVAWVVERTRGESGESGEAQSGTHRENLDSDSDTNTFGEKSETCQRAPRRASPDSPDSPSDSFAWRSDIARWAGRWRDRWNELSKQLAEEGFGKPANEIEAFARVAKEKAEDEKYRQASGGLSGWD